MNATFIGVDLAWQSEKNNSGLVVMRGDDHRLETIDYDSVNKLAEVVDNVTAWTRSTTVVAIDAPLIIKNESGQRPCERLIAQKFSRRHAAAHPANLSLYPDAGSVKCAHMLAERGFRHDIDPAGDRHRRRKIFFEVYPHAAHVVLFDRQRIIKYKRGRVAEKRSGLGELRANIQEKFVRGQPPIELNDKFRALLEQDLSTARGKALKQYEDILDAWICAYIAFFYWRWGAEKNEMIGDLKTGYIINPTEPL